MKELKGCVQQRGPINECDAMESHDFSPDILSDKRMRFPEAIHPS